MYTFIADVFTAGGSGPFTGEFGNYMMPYNGLCKGFQAKTTSSLGAESYVVTLMKNGVATSVTVTLTGSSNEQEDQSNSFTFSKGDIITTRIQISGGTNRPVYWNITFESAAFNQSFMCAGGHLVISSTLVGPELLIQSPGQGIGSGATLSGSNSIFPTSGILRNFYYKLGFAPGTRTSPNNVLNTQTLTVYKNGSPTTLTASVSGLTNTIGSVDSNVSVSSGDTLHVLNEINYSPFTDQTVAWGVTFSPTVNGQSVSIGFKGNLAPSFSSVVASAFSIGGWIGGAIPVSVPRYVPFGFSVKKMMVDLNTAPGAGTSWDFDMTDGHGGADVTCTIADTETSCEWNGTYDFIDDFNNSVNYRANRSGVTATSSHSKCSLLFYKPPRLRQNMFDFFDSSGGNSRGICR